MNTDRLNLQQLFGEPQFITGKKQPVDEPQFVTGREQSAEQLTPLYTQPQHDVRNTGQEQLQGAHTASGGDWQKIPIHSEQEQFLPQHTTHGKEGKEHFSSGGTFELFGEPQFITGKKQLVGEPQQLYPGQEQFVGQHTTYEKEGKEHFSSGGTFELFGEPQFITGKKQQQLYPGQEQFLPQHTTHGKEGNEHFSSGGNFELFGEPQFITGKKQLVGEPQFVTGREQSAEQLTPLYTQPQHDVRNTGQEQLHGAHNVSGADWQKIPIHSGQEQLYPGQEQFVGQHTTHGKEGKEHFSSGGTFQTGEHPKQTEHFGISPNREQHAQVPQSTEHVHINPSEQVRLTPEAEHVHIKVGTVPESGLEQVIRVKPDGSVIVNTEKVGEHGTSTEHGRGTELKDYDTSLTDKGIHHDKPTETETQTIARIKHEPSTKEGKHTH